MVQQLAGLEITASTCTMNVYNRQLQDPDSRLIRNLATYTEYTDQNTHQNTDIGHQNLYTKQAKV